MKIHGGEAVLSIINQTSLKRLHTGVKLSNFYSGKRNRIMETGKNVQIVAQKG